MLRLKKKKVGGWKWKNVGRGEKEYRTGERKGGGERERSLSRLILISFLYCPNKFWWIRSDDEAQMRVKWNPEEREKRFWTASNANLVSVLFSYRARTTLLLRHHNLIQSLPNIAWESILHGEIHFTRTHRREIQPESRQTFRIYPPQRHVASRALVDSTAKPYFSTHQNPWESLLISFWTWLSPSRLSSLSVANLQFDFPPQAQFSLCLEPPNQFRRLNFRLFSEPPQRVLG